MSCDAFVSHACLGPLPADWHEPRPGTRRYAQWDDNTSVVVDISHDPSVPTDVRIRYVGSHQAKIKPGYERVYLRSLQEVNKFEREHGVANHVMHFDRNGRALDDKHFGKSLVH
jgi:hypothetical protein